MQIIKNIWSYRRNILPLIYNDFYQNYFSSYLGFLWAILSPLVSIAVLSIVFQVGFRVQPVDNVGVPFVAWLTCGMICWYFFSEGISRGTSAITAYSFLVRKALFRIALLPPIRTCTPLIIHCFLMLFLLGLLTFFHIYPSIYWIQWFYYVGCLYIFLTGISLITASLTVFVPDISSLVNIIVNVGFWVTPIFWNATMIPERWRWLLQLNPAYYCVQGFRETFLTSQWLWERPLWHHGIFWTWTFLALLLGIFIFKKLRPYFADEL